MSNEPPAPKYLKDYQPPAYWIDDIELHFELDVPVTTVRSRLSIRRNREHARVPVVLDGQDLELVTVKIDGQSLTGDSLHCDAESLTVHDTPEQFVLEVVTRIRPAENTLLEGLYQSGGNFCTQCEAEGFRRITYFLDRPDVMARFRVTLVAERERYPVLLSNGNLVERGDYGDGRHWARWEDPFRKPCYLFALVAGNLVHLEDVFTTRSGREVKLRIYVQEANRKRCDHAMQSLKKAMRWDEEVFALEYDLDVYMIVAIDDFNMGAMENKGLNIFNSKYVLAQPETATDADYQHIEGVIGHEYFHNWTGNRVTCRDWFQLSLKEGLTVFRDQEFSADMSSRPVKRIDDVRVLRNAQFPEDAGPMAHPVRPSSYIEINNFYTATVYSKGAEVIRMIHTLIGRDNFRAGLELYLRRHDGHAVTTDDFVQAMQDASGIGLGQFRLWYSQAGTPVLDVEGDYDAAAATYSLRVRQSCPPTPGQERKEPFHIPLALGLLGPNGKPLLLQLEDEPQADATQTRVLSVRSQEQTFRFVNVPEEPIPSLLRNFSAPVRLNYDYGRDGLAFLLGRDTDPFNRWEAGQRLATQIILELVDARPKDGDLVLDSRFTEAAARTLRDVQGDEAFVAELLTLPSERYLAEQMEVIDVEGIHAARLFVRRSLAGVLREDLLGTYRSLTDTGIYRVDPASIGRRRLKNLCLAYLVETEDDEFRELAMSQFRHAHNMSDVLAALQTLVDVAGPQRSEALASFYERWRHDPLVVDKWLSIQAMSRLPDTLETVKALTRHPAFEIKNPNKVRAVIGAFSHANPVRFHDASGAGYAWLTEQILRIDPLNPQVAARLASAMTSWRRYDARRQALMKAQLERIGATEELSRDVYEIASKSLA
jgi:aminopeptidase N